MQIVDLYSHGFEQKESGGSRGSRELKANEICWQAGEEGWQGDEEVWQGDGGKDEDNRSNIFSK